MTSNTVALAGLLALTVIAACGDDGLPRCVAGTTQGCACTATTMGVQECRADGTFGACVCGGDVDGGPSDAGPTDAEIGTDAAPGDASMDAGDDAGPGDSGADAGTDGATPDAGASDAGGACDADADGHASGSCGGDDCDDSDAAVHPGATEVCNARDDDCDGAVDETAIPGMLLCYDDGDGDGYAAAGAGAVVRIGCSCAAGTTDRAPATGSTDCDDAASAAHPLAAETCNGVDDDCDTVTDGAAATAWCGSAALPPRATAAVCAAGVCEATACESPYLDCGAAAGCETDSSTSGTSCGACGRACAWGRCAVGTCNDAVEISAGQDHTCARRADGTVVCWGIGGALGDGAAMHTRCGMPFPLPGTDCSRSPVLVAGLDDAVQLAAGGGYTCARRATGGVSCWGANAYGQLGDGTTTSRSAPVAVVGLSDAVDIAAGPSAAHTCARRATGAVVCWGWNVNGCLGDGVATHTTCGGTSDCALTPVTVVGLTSPASIATGIGQSCAVRATGEVACWGWNARGQIGDGTLTNRPAPTAVVGISGASTVACGADASCALLPAGGVSCWGGNTNGQLGDGTTTDRALPVTVAGLTDAAQLAVGSACACARRMPGTVTCWGGISSELSTLTDAVELTVGGRHACARRASGAIVCWGRNTSGELGNGTSTDSSAPVVVVAP